MVKPFVATNNTMNAKQKLEEKCTIVFYTVVVEKRETYTMQSSSKKILCDPKNGQ